jgi:hypothetical protein
MEHISQPSPSPERRPVPRPAEVEERLTIEDITEAREYIAELLAAGTRPIVTVPEQYAEQVLKEGIHTLLKEDGLTGKKFSFIAGTIGVPILSPSDEDRFVLSVDTDTVKIEPRLTGSDKAFHGVVHFPNGIPARAITVLGTARGSQFTPLEKGDVAGTDVKTPLH